MQKVQKLKRNKGTLALGRNGKGTSKTLGRQRKGTAGLSQFRSKSQFLVLSTVPIPHLDSFSDSFSFLVPFIIPDPHLGNSPVPSAVYVIYSVLDDY